MQGVMWCARICSAVVMTSGGRSGLPDTRQSWNFVSHKQIEVVVMARPNPERQVHRACGDVGAALLDEIVGLPAEQLPPWSYSRSRKGKKPLFVVNSADGDHGLDGRASAS